MNCGITSKKTEKAMDMACLLSCQKKSHCLRGWFSWHQNSKEAMEKVALFKPDVVCTDNYKVYNRVIPNDILVQSKSYTHNIEGHNSSLKDFIKRYNRKTKAYSKASDMAELSVYIHFFYNTIFI